MYNIFMKEFSLILGDCEPGQVLLMYLFLQIKEVRFRELHRTCHRPWDGVTVLALNLTSSFQI